MNFLCPLGEISLCQNFKLCYKITSRIVAISPLNSRFLRCILALECTTNMEKYAMRGAYAKNMKERRRTALAQENRHVTEWRWEEGNELVTHVCMKKKGCAWRSIVYRETIEDFEETLS